MKNTHSFNFLLELIIVILFFTLSSIVFVGLFVKAYRMNEEARIKAEVSTEVQNLVEEFKMTGSLESTSIKKEDYTISATIEGRDCHIEASNHGEILEEVNVIYLEVSYE